MHKARLIAAALSCALLVGWALPASSSVLSSNLHSRQSHLRSSPALLATISLAGIFNEMAYGAGALWVTAFSNGLDHSPVTPALRQEVVEVKPDGSVTTINVGSQAGSVAVVGHQVWVTTSSNQVVILDGRTHARIGSIKIRDPGPIASGVNGLVAISKPRTVGRITIIDANRRKILKVLDTRSLVDELGFVNDQLWVLGFGPTLTILDPRTGTRIGTIKLPVVDKNNLPSLLNVQQCGQAVVVSGSDGDGQGSTSVVLWTIDARSRRLISETKLGSNPFINGASYQAWLSAGPMGLCGVSWHTTGGLRMFSLFDATSQSIVSSLALPVDGDYLQYGGGVFWVAEEAMGKIVTIAPGT